ncbi:MAG: hypothetical protein H6755_00240 [Candidatus Omnitrophica bacterium]|nr:hypothetical protein [Candidatus Omnitrophota bacterium]
MKETNDIIPKIDNDKWNSYYEQACEAFRHYSLHVREIRTVSIAQGLTVLAGSAFLTNQSQYSQALAAIGFGFLLTITLWSMHKMYFDHSMEMQKYISEILEDKDGPWTNHRESRRKRLEGRFKHGLFKHGVFILLMISFLTLTLFIISRWSLQN